MSKIISNKEITDIYNKYILVNYTEENRCKHVPLSFELNDKALRWEKMDFPRVISVLELREYMISNNLNFKEVLSFYGESDPEFVYMKYERCYSYVYKDDIKTKLYDGNVEYDLHNFDLTKRDFDFAILNQTLEHLYNPLLALKNIFNHLKDGGMFYTNVPVNNVPHCDPFHFYTGLTPMGLAVLIRLAGFDILQVGQWGNKIYQKQMFDKLWSNYTYTENPGYNDFDCPLITWCWAIKNVSNN